MTNERIGLDRNGLPKRGEAGYDPIEEEQDVQDRGGMDDPPDDEVTSIGQTESLGHMDVSDLSSTSEAATDAPVTPRRKDEG